MTREEAITQLEILLEYCESMMTSEYPVWRRDCEALQMLIAALHPVSWEKVVQAWRGQWVKCKHADYYVCNKCSTVSKTGEDEFCKSCGAPMKGEAVQMVIERLEEMYENQ